METRDDDTIPQFRYNNNYNKIKYITPSNIGLPHVNSCEEPIIEGEPHWHCNASDVVIIGKEYGVSLSSSKGNEPVNSQSGAAYS